MSIGDGGKELKRRILGTFLVGFLMMAAGDGRGQVKAIAEKIAGKIPGLDSILKKEPAITTSFDDAIYIVPFLDDFDPREFVPIESLKRTGDGSVEFSPGLYRFDVQSFCLQAATKAPRKGRGNGYVYAPIRGPRAGIVTNIARRTFEHPEIPQQSVQELLWAIITYTKLSSMPPERQLVASKLLTSKEMLEINGGALGLVPEGLADEVLAELPEEVGRLIKAEGQIREMLTEAGATYEDIADVAVLRDDSEDAEEQEEEGPNGQWSLRPEGVFVRYFPYDYDLTRVEMYIPEFFKIETDKLGRITLVSDRAGSRIEAVYDDSVAPLPVAGEPVLKGYALGTIKFERPDPAKPGEKLVAQYDKAGWTFVGVPAGKGTAAGGPASERYSDRESRYQLAREHKSELDALDKLFAHHGDPAMPVNLGHFAMALKDVVKPGDDEEGAEDESWTVRFPDLVKKAWQFEIWKREMYREKAGGDGAFVANDAVFRIPETQRLMLRWYLRNWHLYEFPWISDSDPDRFDVPIRRPMMIVGVVR